MVPALQEFIISPGRWQHLNPACPTYTPAPCRLLPPLHFHTRGNILNKHSKPTLCSSSPVSKVSTQAASPSRWPPCLGPRWRWRWPACGRAWCQTALCCSVLKAAQWPSHGALCPSCRHWMLGGRRSSWSTSLRRQTQEPGKEICFRKSIPQADRSIFAMRFSTIIQETNSISHNLCPWRVGVTIKQLFKILFAKVEDYS